MDKVFHYRRIKVVDVGGSYNLEVNIRTNFGPDKKEEVGTIDEI